MSGCVKIHIIEMMENKKYQRRTWCARALIFLLLFQAPVAALFAQDQAGDNADDADQESIAGIELWEDTLRYGTDREIREIIPALIINNAVVLQEPMRALLSVDANFSTNLRIDVINFFRRLELFVIADDIAPYLDPTQQASERFILTIMSYYQQSPPDSLNADILDSVIYFIDDDRVTVGRAAIDVLAIHGSTENLEILADFIIDDSLPDDIRGGAILAVGEQRYQPAEVDLITVLNNEVEQGYIRRYAATAIGQLQNPHSIAQLENYIHDENSLLRASVIAAIISYNEEASGEIFEIALRDSNPDIRLSALDAIDQPIQDQDLVMLVAYRARNDMDASVMNAAINALLEYGGETGSDVLLEQINSTQVPYLVRANIIAGLVEQHYDKSKQQVIDLIVEEHGRRRSFFLPAIANSLASKDTAHAAEVYSTLLDADESDALVLTLRVVAANSVVSLSPKVEEIVNSNSDAAVKAQAKITLDILNKSN